jgi:hypothetical protein
MRRGRDLQEPHVSAASVAAWLCELVDRLGRAAAASACARRAACAAARRMIYRYTMSQQFRRTGQPQREEHLDCRGALLPVLSLFSNRSNR